MAEQVVWVTAVPPDHDGTGGQLRQAHLLDAVATRRPITLVVAGTVRDPAVRAAVDSIVPVPHLPATPLVSPWRRRSELVRHVLTDRVPFEVARAREQRDAFGPAMAEVVAPGDTVLVEHLGLAPLGRDLPSSTTRVLTLHHAAARQAAHQLALAPTARRAWWWRDQARRANRLEAWAATAFDRVVTVSQLDATAVAAPSIVVPNGVAIGALGAPAPRDRTVVLTGTLDYGPNVDGATWFASRAWPLIRAAVPTARLRVVGHSPVPEVAALDGRDGIEVHADVAEIEPWIDDADVAVVPLRIGGGTRLKALQAMARSRPVVGTTIGLEGLAVTDDVDAIVRDDARGLATAVTTLLTDHDVADRIAAAGRARVEAEFDWTTIGHRFATDVLGLA